MYQRIHCLFGRSLLRNRPLRKSLLPKGLLKQSLMSALCLCAIATELQAQLLAGFGERDITPELIDSWIDVDGNAQFDPEIDAWEDVNKNGAFDGVWMAGFQNNRPAQGVESPLKAVAMVVDDGRYRIGIVAADTIGLMRTFVQDLRRALPPSLGLDYVLVHATHNHEGPDTQGLWGTGPMSSGVDPDYMVFLRDQMMGALADGVSALEPARLHMASIPNTPMTPIRDARKPEVIDDQIRVLVLESVDQRILGSIVNFGIHVELAWDRNLKLTSDVAGYLREGLSRGIVYDGELLKEGIGGTTLWLTGNIGGLMTSGPGEWVDDPFLNERISDGGHAKARAFGYGLASAVIDGWQNKQFWSSDQATLDVMARDVELGISNWMLALATLTGVVDSSPSLHLTPPFVRYTSEISWIKLGQATLTGIPGELYPEIAVGGIENPLGADFEIAPVEVPPLRDALSGRVNLMVNLANDAIGYIIPKSEWDNEAPWIYGETEETYGEIVSLGEETAPTLHERLMLLLREVQGRVSEEGSTSLDPQ